MTGGTGTPGSNTERTRAARIEMLAQQSRSGTRAAAVATAGLGLLIVPAAGWLPYGLWALCMLVAYPLRDAVVSRIVAARRFSERDENVAALSSAGLAIVVSSAGPFFMPLMSADARGLYTAVQVAWVAIAALVIGIHPRGYAAYVAASYGILAIGWWRAAPDLAAVATLMLAIAGFVLVRFAQRLAGVFDRSVRIRSENEELVEQLQASLAETAQAQQARSRFLAAASHDLLQPVHALTMLVGVLRDSTTEATREQAAHRIELTTQSIASMFRGLLDRARLDAGAMTSRPEPVRLEAVCSGVEAAYSTRCRERGVELQVRCDAEVVVLADAALLDRVLRNLVDNAVKFTESGRVSIVVQPGSDTVLLEVIDTGAGIAVEEQPRVFDAFFRGARASEQGIEGIGLGLSVTAQMVELMRGRIEIASVPGQGTRVQLRLPAASAEAPAPAEAPAAPRALLLRRVLLVEDDRNAREAVQLWLADHACQIVSAACLRDALEQCAHRTFVPQFVLSDLQLADGPDGLRTIAALRERFGPVPAALVTGHAIAADQVPGDVTLLRKPLQPEHLLRLLQGRIGTA